MPFLTRCSVAVWHNSAHCPPPPACMQSRGDALRVLLCIDARQSLRALDRDFILMLEKEAKVKYFVVMTKCDLVKSEELAKRYSPKLWRWRAPKTHQLSALEILIPIFQFPSFRHSTSFITWYWYSVPQLTPLPFSSSQSHMRFCCIMTQIFSARESATRALITSHMHARRQRYPDGLLTHHSRSCRASPSPHTRDAAELDSFS